MAVSTSKAKKQGVAAKPKPAAKSNDQSIAKPADKPKKKQGRPNKAKPAAESNDEKGKPVASQIKRVRPPKAKPVAK